MQTSHSNQLEELAIKSQAGDKASYELFLHSVSKLARQKYRPVFYGQNLDDFVQEVLIAVHRSLHTYRPVEKFMPWLKAICSHKANDLLRKIYRQKMEDPWDESIAPNDPPDPALGFEEKSQLQVLLNLLSPKELAVIQLVKIEERSVQAAAQQLGLSVSNIKIICYRAIHKLQSAAAKEAFRDRN